MGTKEEIYNRQGEFVGERDQWAVFQRVVETDGEFLWPRTRRSDGKYFGFDMKELARIKAGYEDKVQFYAQYYNDPNQVGVADITPDMFMYYDPEKLSCTGGVWHYNGDLLNVYGAFDFAYSLKDGADWSVIAAVGVDAYKNYYILGLDRFKTDRVREYFSHLIEMHNKWNFKKVRLEATAAQSVIIKELKRTMQEEGVRMPIEEYKPLKDKIERMAAVLRPKYEDHRVYHYRGGNCELLESELTQARPEHDDIKNAVADALEISVAPTATFYKKNVQNFVKRLGRFGGTCICH
jgi:hypothetical protein